MPFGGRRDTEVLRNVEKATYNVSGREWRYISKSAKDLIQKMLNPDFK
jgi:hypothetical protein